MMRKPVYFDRLLSTAAVNRRTPNASRNLCTQRIVASFAAAGLIVFICALAAFSARAADWLSLSGDWRFAIDRADTGIIQRWFARDLSDTIRLPGALQSQDYGDEISIKTPWVLSLYDTHWYLREDYRAFTNAGKVKVPFIAQPPRHYLGVAWYQRDIQVPANWQGRTIALSLERPHWESRVWVDDRLIGSTNSLCAPHEFNLGKLAPGKHRLSVRVDNRMLMPYRPDAHSVSDSLGQTWNGIAGEIRLDAVDAARISNLRIDPDLEHHLIEVRVAARNDLTNAVLASVVLQVAPENFDGDALNQVQQSSTIAPGDSVLTFSFPMGDNFELWSEFNPKVYNLRATMDGTAFHSEANSTFGMREFKVDGQEFVMNGRKTNLRGTHHGGDFPLTGYPPTDVEYWLKVFDTCREWGLNHVRFHSFCPPEAAFIAADEAGVYLQIEPGMWNEISPNTPMEKMLYAETERILAAYGNHPSFVMFSASNEPKGRWKESLPRWVEHFRKEDPRHLYTTGTGWPLIDSPGPVTGADYLAIGRFGATDRVRGETGWFGRDYSHSLRNVNVPVVGHEIGQWCAYPDYSVIGKFTGYMQPGNYEIFRDSAIAHGLFEGRAGTPLPAESFSSTTGRQRSASPTSDESSNSPSGGQRSARPTSKDFAWASGRFQLECYKEEIEANLRTPGMGGFQLLDLHDYLGQGTALVGLLDPFWESKGYATPIEFQNFCGPTVPLARLRQRVFTTADKLEASAEVAHYGEGPLDNMISSWVLMNDSMQVVTNGVWPARTIPLGKGTALGTISADLSAVPPGAYNLIVGLVHNSQTQRHPIFSNQWKLWIYPAQDVVDAPSDVLVTTSWDDAEAKLKTGGKVLYMPRNADLDWSSPPLAELPVFWNRLMNPAWGRMLGLWCDTNHPALAEFPTEPNCDWQWTQIIRGTRAINLERLPKGLLPIAQAIDDWNRNWKLGTIFECHVGSGRLMVCAFDLSRDLQNRPVARQLRRSLLDYMASKRFQPMFSVTPEEFSRVLFDTRVMSKLNATVSGDGVDLSAAIDGDPNTAWVAGARPLRGTNAPSPYPHWIAVRFPTAVPMNGLVLMPRQNDRDHLGDVREYKIEVSDDGAQWKEVLHGELPSTWSPQRLTFPSTVNATQVRFTALSGFGNDTSAALAEIAIMYAGPKLADAGRSMEYERSRSTSTDVDEGGDVSKVKTKP